MTRTERRGIAGHRSTELAWVVAMVLAAFTAASPRAAHQRGGRDESVGAMLTRGGTFVRAMEADLSTVIADETYQQDLYPPNLSRSGNRTLSQTLHSEVLFLWLPERNGWLFVR